VNLIPLPRNASGPPTRPPVRILFLLDVLNVVGGTEKQLRELIQHMDRSRFDPIVITLYSKDMPHEAEFGGMGCLTYSLGMRKLLSVNGLRTCLRLISKIRREHIDIVHTFFPDASILGTIAGRLGGARVVVARRDLGYWYTRRYLFIHRLLQRFAHAYLVNSQAVRSVVCKSEGVDLSRAHVIHNGFFTPQSSPSRLTLSDLGFPPDARLVGIVANLRQIKRLDRFVEMAAKMRDPKTYFLIVGYGELHEALLAQARLAGLGDRLRITHKIDGVLDIVKLFQVAVLTSESEGLSNTLVEYGLAGVPAVAFDVGGNRDVIEDKNSGFLVEPYDVAALRERVEELLSDPALRQRMGSRARKVCTDRFGGERMVAETQAFYERLTGLAT
jgi:glycosyltransferase involved in cell wall biosynthesis